MEKPETSARIGLWIRNHKTYIQIYWVLLPAFSQSAYHISVDLELSSKFRNVQNSKHLEILSVIIQIYQSWWLLRIVDSIGSEDKEDWRKSGSIFIHLFIFIIAINWDPFKHFLILNNFLLCIQMTFFLFFFIHSL